MRQTPVIISPRLASSFFQHIFTFVFNVKASTFYRPGEDEKEEGHTQESARLITSTQ